MKKLNLFLLSFMLIASGFLSTAKAQWTDMEWDTYKIGFKAPSDFTLKENDDKAFTANGAIFTMSIKPWSDAAVTEPLKICQKALDITPGTDKTVVAEEVIHNLNGLEGYEAYCTATQNGKFMHIVIGGYLDPATSTNFTVQLLFWDNAAQNDKNYEAALYILQSFHVVH